MLAPKARRALRIVVTITTALVLSSVILAYLLWLSPSAKARRLELSGDNNYNQARQIVSEASKIARMEQRATGLIRAAEFNPSEPQKALTFTNKALEDYNELLKYESLDNQIKERVKKKLKSSEHLLLSSKSFINWLKEAKRGANTVRYAKLTFTLQSKGMNLLNKTVVQINKKKALESTQTVDEILEYFTESKESIKKIEKSIRNQDIGQLKIMTDLYLEATKSLKKMAGTPKNNTDAYNIEVEKLNTVAKQASKIAGTNFMIQDLNNWLENNFYYDGGPLIFHYKKAEETWPN